MVASFSSMPSSEDDDLTAGENGDILQHLLASVAEAGGLDGYAAEGAAESC